MIAEGLKLETAIIHMTTVSQRWHLVSDYPAIRFTTAPQLGHSPWCAFVGSW